MSNRTIKFRGMRKDNNEWVYGDLVHRALTAFHYVSEIGIKPIDCYPIAVIPETVGQLRYTSPKGVEYYDGDVYYHAGYGDETISDLCELQTALMTGNTEDIGDIKYNIHQHPHTMDKSTITDKPMQAVKYNPYEAIDNAAKSTKRQFGYKGTETAINGLLNFMDRLNRKHGINDKGKSVDRYDNNIKKIIEFGKMNHLLLLTTNRIDKDADLIAKKIDKRLMYSDFKNWYTNELLNQHHTHNG